MGIVSYAQNFEDVILWRALHDVSPGFYIDIGAQHPVVDSVSKAFYEQGWRGIHVEPTTLHANLLRADRPDETVVQAIIADQAGAMKFYEIEGTGLSTARQDIADEHRAKLSYPVRETLVTAITLSDLLELAPQDDIHWLKVDVEGFERQVFSGWMQSHRRPWIIAVESTYPNTPTDTSAEWESLVVSKGYRLVYCDGLNRFYLHHDRTELESRFAYPPNVFDGFQLSGSATSMTSLLVQRNQKDVSQLESRLAATEEKHRSIAQALVEQQSRAARQTGELQQELGALRSTLQNTGKESAERERLTAEAFGQARDEMRLHAQVQLENLLRRERELGEQLLRQQEASRQNTLEMVRANAEREAALQQELTALRAELEKVKEEAAARERQQQEAFSQVRDDMSRKGQVQLQALLDRERELGERLLQQQEASRQNTVEMGRVSAEREVVLQQELATLRAELEKAKEEAAARERQQQEAFSQVRDDMSREAQAQLQALLDRERELGERLLLQQLGAHSAALAASQASSEREATLQAQASEKLTQQLQETHHFRLECEALAGRLALEQEMNRQSAAALAVNLACLGEVQGELDRLQQSWSWRLTAPFRLFKGNPRILHVTPPIPAPAASSSDAVSRLTPLAAPVAVAAPEVGFEAVEDSRPAVALEAVANTYFQTESVQQKVTAMPTDPSQSLDELLALPAQSFIQQAYRILLNRAPDPDGMRYYQGRLRTGHGRSSVLAQLARSQEFSHALDKLLEAGNDEAFLEAIYRRYLERSADPAGLQHYKNALKNGVDRKKIAREIGRSKEAVMRNSFWLTFDQLMEDETKTRNWFWNWFARTKRIEQQLNREYERLMLIATQFTSAHAQTLARIEQLERCMRHQAPNAKNELANVVSNVENSTCKKTSVSIKGIVSGMEIFDSIAIESVRDKLGYMPVQEQQ